MTNAWDLLERNQQMAERFARSPVLDALDRQAQRLQEFAASPVVGRYARQYAEMNRRLAEFAQSDAFQRFLHSAAAMSAHEGSVRYRLEMAKRHRALARRAAEFMTASSSRELAATIEAKFSQVHELAHHVLGPVAAHGLSPPGRIGVATPHRDASAERPARRSCEGRRRPAHRRTRSPGGSRSDQRGGDGGGSDGGGEGPPTGDSGDGRFRRWLRGKRKRALTIYAIVSSTLGMLGWFGVSPAPGPETPVQPPTAPCQPAHPWREPVPPNHGLRAVGERIKWAAGRKRPPTA
jgi:hypothetical protein